MVIPVLVLVGAAVAMMVTHRFVRDTDAKVIETLKRPLLVDIVQANVVVVGAAKKGVEGDGHGGRRPRGRRSARR